MPKAIKLESDLKVEEIYAFAKKEKKGKLRARLLGIASVLEGKSRSESARLAGLTESAFRVWVRRFNEGGIEALEEKKSTGRPRKLNQVVEEALRNKLEVGASYEKDGRVTYRLLDLQSYLENEHGLKLSQSGIWYIIKDMDFSWLSVRPKHRKTDDQAIEAFKKTSRQKLKK